ncbi:MAG TPA: hypothetical protein VII78_04885 [Myxococcota bacterium]
MREAPIAPRSRALRIPLWDDYGQAERFAGGLGFAALAAAAPYVLSERIALAEICIALATLLIALCLASDRGAPRWVLGIGTPAVMSACALALLLVTGGRGVVAAALLALAPAIATLWSSALAGFVFLALAIASSGLVLAFAPGSALAGAEPWIGDPRAPWLVAPLGAGLLLLARSWIKAHGDFHQDVAASHAVLAASEARFKAYVENAHDVTAELDGHGRVLFITAQKQAHYALPVAELLGTDGGAYIHPDDLPGARRAFEAAAGGRPNVSAPIRYRGAAEGWRYLRFALNSYRTQEGRLRFVLQARDETALQEAQLERDRVVSELEHALARIETLRGRVAICATCKDVKNEAGEWERVDEYLASRTLAELSHGMCPRCVEAKTA